MLFYFIIYELVHSKGANNVFLDWGGRGDFPAIIRWKTAELQNWQKLFVPEGAKFAIPTMVLLMLKLNCLFWHHISGSLFLHSEKESTESKFLWHRVHTAAHLSDLNYHGQNSPISVISLY